MESQALLQICRIRLCFNKIPRSFVFTFKFGRYSPQPLWCYYPATVGFFLPQACFLAPTSGPLHFLSLLPDASVPKLVMSSQAAFPQCLSPRELHGPAVFSHIIFLWNGITHIYVFTCLLSVSCHWSAKLHTCRNALPAWFTVLFPGTWNPAWLKFGIQ